ncbi:MAG: MBL fold metallo-hydrolase [Eubacteriales bacterium]|nr:MBL fold metallo-hydrolase [Eubacteriales bacterium]
MIIKTLVENTTLQENLEVEHGLSLYIETKKHKILFDTGESGIFAQNAIKMDVDLSAVDMVVISHGHYDHGGGLKTFLSLNSKAKIYVNKKTFDKHYAIRPNGVKTYIGLDEGLLGNDRFIFAGNSMVVDDEIELFSGVKAQRLNPSGNQDLLMMNGDEFIPDDFHHEQNMIINEDDKTILVAGCAHNGIVNIMDHYHYLKNSFPNHVVGGFHLYNRSRNTNENPMLVDEIGESLLKTGSQYYTGHCTGMESFSRLKKIMGNKIDYLATGSQIII